MRSLSNISRIARTAIAILNYLCAHPDAEDTVVGIAQWWVGETPMVVEKALDLLFQKGAIHKRGENFRAKKKKFSDEELRAFSGFLKEKLKSN